MVMGFRNLKMEHLMKVSGGLIKHMGRVSFIILMVTYLMDSGSMAKPTATVSILISTALNTKAFGKMISSTEKEKKSGPTVQNTMVTTSMGRSKVSAFTSGLINLNMMENGWTTE